MNNMMRRFICLVIALRASMAQTATDGPSPDSSVSPNSLATDSPISTLSYPPSFSTRPSVAPTASTLPTFTAGPSFPPSPSPTYSPTLSSMPTLSARPSEEPSYLPSFFPSIHPTLSAAQSVSARYEQRLLVPTSQEFTGDDIKFFQYLYQRYTKSFGYNVTKPQIVTHCHIEKQTVSDNPINVTIFHSSGLVRRQRRTQEFAYVLSVTFTMEHQTKSTQYDISNYNSLFKDYVNQNTTKVTVDMALLGLPVVHASGVIMFTAPAPTPEPTRSPTVSPAPSIVPTTLPSELPSSAPSKDFPSIDVVSSSFALGISLGIAGACVIVLLGYMYRSHLEKSDDEHLKNSDDDEGEGIEMGIEVTDLPDGTDDRQNDSETKQTESVTGSASAFTFDAESAVRLDSNEHRSTMDSSTFNRQFFAQSEATSASYEHFLGQGMSGTLRETQRGSEMFPDGNNTGMVHAASFSSSNGSYEEGIQQADSYNESFHASMFDGSTDELDNYKNTNIEVFRDAVEQAVYDVEGMMMLAVTNALTQSPSQSADGQDHSALEAESLYQTYDWWKRNEHSPIDSRKEYFQELLNRIVNLVFYGLVPPLQGSQIIHGCATIIGLPLVHTFPQTTLIIHGMLKTNNLALGQKCIKRAFKPFGEIECAAIAPNNHGFGFVRFVQAKSAQKALREYRDNEIVIQDVAVSVKVLKSEGIL